jgi:hypothetical protein
VLGGGWIDRAIQASNRTQCRVAPVPGVGYNPQSDSLGK